MKFTIGAVLLINSVASFADYNCHELESKLIVTKGVGAAITATYIPKSGGAAKTFYGVKVPTESSFYNKVQQFKLKGQDGVLGTLKISTVQLMSRVPACHGRRICDDNVFNAEVSAELDVQGKVVDYVCKETF
ncbi:MAG TPA: hypothetical protein VNJ01_10555 [Bacteriovoracaceae bacterium]|nr:hypothetical protein [Bacteriovoracaceae bacterium]